MTTATPSWLIGWFLDETDDAVCEIVVDFVDVVVNVGEIGVDFELSSSEIAVLMSDFTSDEEGT